MCWGVCLMKDQAIECGNGTLVGGTSTSFWIL